MDRGIAIKKKVPRQPGKIDRRYPLSPSGPCRKRQRAVDIFADYVPAFSAGKGIPFLKKYGLSFIYASKAGKCV